MEQLACLLAASPGDAVCRLYRRQLELLRCQAAKLTLTLPESRLDHQARERIRARLRGAIDNRDSAD